MNTEQAIAILGEFIREARKGVNDMGYHEFYGEENVFEALEYSFDTLCEKQERENPKPLTLEELRERIGDWIWIEVKGKSNQTGWNRLSIDLRPWEHELYTNVVPEGYGKTWLAYDHEPKENYNG